MNRSLRQTQKTAARERIPTAARKEFAAHGFCLPTAEIAKAAGLSHGSVFLHFSTREQLIDCVIQTSLTASTGKFTRRRPEAQGLESCWTSIYPSWKHTKPFTGI